MLAPSAASRVRLRPAFASPRPPPPPGPASRPDVQPAGPYLRRSAGTPASVRLVGHYPPRRPDPSPHVALVAPKPEASRLGSDRSDLWRARERRDPFPTLGSRTPTSRTRARRRRKGRLHRHLSGRGRNRHVGQDRPCCSGHVAVRRLGLATGRPAGARPARDSAAPLRTAAPRVTRRLGPAARPGGTALPADGLLQLGLVHRRAALDAGSLRLGRAGGTCGHPASRAIAARRVARMRGRRRRSGTWSAPRRLARVPCSRCAPRSPARCPRLRRGQGAPP